MHLAWMLRHSAVALILGLSGPHQLWRSLCGAQSLRRSVDPTLGRFCARSLQRSVIAVLPGQIWHSACPRLGCFSRSVAPALCRSSARSLFCSACSPLCHSGARRLTSPLLDCPGSRSALSATRRSSALGPFAHYSFARSFQSLTAFVIGFSPAGISGDSRLQRSATAVHDRSSP